MSTQIHRISDRAPEFPCWLWGRINAIYPSPVEHWRPHSFMPNAGLHYLPGRPDDKLRPGVFLATHWHPDQPSAPTATPPTEQATEGEQVESHSFVSAEDLEEYKKRFARHAPAPAVSQPPSPGSSDSVHAGTPVFHPPAVSGEDSRRNLPAVAQGETPEIVMRNALCRVYEIINGSDDFDADEVNAIIKAATGKFPISREWSMGAAYKEELANLRQQLAQVEKERDQARQDLEEKCAENDRERAAHLQAYQAAVKERDEARAELPKEAFASNVAIIELQGKLTAAESELAEARKDRERCKELELCLHGLLGLEGKDTSVPKLKGYFENARALLLNIK